MQVNTLVREFEFNGARLPDPNPALSVDGVRELYCAQYPSLNNATVEGPEMKGGKAVYSFKAGFGAKG
jgi:PRTRC genetic system protein C